MTRFYLIRHGEIPFVPGDPGLTDVGRVQAAGVGVFLQDKGVAQLYSSPLVRARQTAEIIAAMIGMGDDNASPAPLPVVVDPRLRERLNWGDVADQNWAEFSNEWERANTDRDYFPPGGLSARQAAANLAEFLQETAGQSPSQTVAVVSHGGIITDYLLEYIAPAEMVRFNQRWPFEPYSIIRRCSITILDYDSAGSQLRDLALEID